MVNGLTESPTNNLPFFSTIIYFAFNSYYEISVSSLKNKVPLIESFSKVGITSTSTIIYQPGLTSTTSPSYGILSSSQSAAFDQYLNSLSGSTSGSSGAQLSLQLTSFI